MNLAIFDIDGTLTDSFGFDVHYYAALSRRLDVPVPNRSLASWENVTDEGIVHEFFELHDRRATAADIDWIKGEYARSLKVHLHRVPQIPGAAEFLASIRARPDWRVVIATGNWTFAGEWKLDAGGVDREGITVVGCDGRPRRTSVMEHALRLTAHDLGSVDHCVFVGDAPYDVAAARTLGWNFVGVGADRERLTKLGATMVISNYVDHHAAFEALTSASVPASIERYFLSRNCATNFFNVS